MALIDTIKKIFARNLRTLRKIQDLTQEEFAERLNENYKDTGIALNRAAIASYEREDGAIPKMDVLHCIAHYFEMKTDELFSENLDKNFLSGIGKEGGRMTAIPGRIVLSEEEWNGFKKEYYDSLVLRKFYMDYLAAIKKSIEESNLKVKDKEVVVGLMRSQYIECYMERSSIFERFLNEELEEGERFVFKRLMVGTAKVEELSALRNTKEKDIVDLFKAAKSKILDFLSAILLLLVCIW
jgi:transcriptional regulator with XRE-family HTH domain